MSVQGVVTIVDHLLRMHLCQLEEQVIVKTVGSLLECFLVLGHFGQVVQLHFVEVEEITVIFLLVLCDLGIDLLSIDCVAFLHLVSLF